MGFLFCSLAILVTAPFVAAALSLVLKQPEDPAPAGKKRLSKALQVTLILMGDAVVILIAFQSLHQYYN